MCTQTIPSVIAKTDVTNVMILTRRDSRRYFATYESHTPRIPDGQNASALSWLIPHFQMSHLYAVSTVQVSHCQIRLNWILMFAQILPVNLMVIATAVTDRESSEAMMISVRDRKVAVARGLGRLPENYLTFLKKSLERSKNGT